MYKMYNNIYAGNEAVEAYVKENKYEVELYSKYKQHYGYVFYIGQKMANHI